METVKSPAEHRVILHNTSWATYERLIKERGENRAPRFAYDRGELEIMSPSTEHESIAYYIGLLVAVFADEAGVDLYGAGSTTFDPLAQSLIFSKSSSSKGVVFTLAVKVARLLMSVPTAWRPREHASTSVVPPPIEGSKTTSPGCVNISMAALANKGDNRAG
jgi:hypothetical protein